MARRGPAHRVHQWMFRPLALRSSALPLRDLADRLVVGLNSAASVRRLKGPNRPINDELTRMHLLAALEVVDAVVVFEADTPIELIKIVQPDFLVKGGDWKPEQIVGSDLVLARGGQVLSLPFVEGYSTTNIEQKILGNDLRVPIT